nr:neural cell adhesion molecule L1 isoform X2 [Paramormyrops kingsleyae]
MPSAQCHQAGRRGQCVPFPLGLLLLLLSLALEPGQAVMHIPAKYQISEFKQPPIITVQPESLTAFAPEDINLTCEATGNPRPSFRWVKDGEEFDPTSDPQLTTSPNSGSFFASGNDPISQYEGKYSCYAFNSLGTAVSNEAQIIIENAPMHVKEKKIRKKAEEGDSAVLNCNPPLSTVPPNIHWMDKNMRHIEQSARVTQGQDGNLYFANVKADDSRNDYICHAQYISARTILPKEPISLIVTTTNSVVRNRRPHLLLPTNSHSTHLALRGKKLELECIAEGLPTPTIQWVRKDGALSESRISKQNFNRLLLFTNVSESDDGEYQCTASNSQGVAMHSYTITVEAAPYWIKQPESQIYAPGETVRLHCQAEGIPTPSITWSLNGVPTSGVELDPRRSVEGGTLILEDVQPTDTAIYQCAASNTHGTALLNAYIYVIELPPQILTDDGLSYSVTEGQTAQLNCESFGSPKPRVTWESESSDMLLSDPRASLLASGSLQITKVSKEDQATYICSVLSTNLSITANLEVLNKTVIVSPPESLRVQHGDMAVLNCQAQVDSKLMPPVFQWRKNGQKIFDSPSDDKYTVDGSTLIVSHIQHEDEGMYTCNVITRLDMAHASGSIIIIDKPDPPLHLIMLDITDRGLTLSWKPGDDHNSPVLEFMVEYEEEQFGKGEWIEAIRVSGEMDQAYIPLRPFGTYRFRVTAVNEVGKSKPTVLTDIHRTPPAAPDMNPEDVRSESVDPDILVITWEEMDPQTFNGPGFKYRVMWRRTVGQGPQWHHNYTSMPPFIVPDVGTFTPFDIKVQAINDFGEAPDPDPEIGYSGEDVPLEAPLGVGVEVMNSTAVKVKWAPVNTQSVRGHLLGYKVHLRRLGSRSGRERRGKREMDKENVVTVKTGASEEHKVLGGLQPFSHYTTSVSAFNSKGEGPHSEPINFHTPEGVPSPPTSLHLDSPSDTELTLHWTPPAHPNGILIGYFLQYQKISDNEDGTMHSETINNHTATHIMLHKLDPQSRYRFYLRGQTMAGKGEVIIKEGATMLDGGPPTNISISAGRTYANISWVSGDRHRNVAFYIHYINKNANIKWTRSETLNSTQRFYQLQGLEPGCKYRLLFISNKTFWDTVIQTQGEGMIPVREAFVTQGWFIGLISVIVVLLLVLIILCIIKRTKGVKDKEECQVDSEARPMKDEQFGEYRSLDSDIEEKRTLSQRSLCVESKVGSEGSLTGLAEVIQVDGHTDDSGLEAQSSVTDPPAPVSQSAEPPATQAAPSSVTGILD